MSRVVRLALELPEERPHRALAIRVVLLSVERSLVGGHLAQILCTRAHCLRNGLEAVTNGQFVLRQRRVTLVAVAVESVDSLAVGVLGRRSAVRHHQIIAVVVTIDLFRSFHGALDVLNSGSAYFCFCHVASANIYSPRRGRG